MAADGTALAIRPMAADGTALAIRPMAADGTALAIRPMAADGTALAIRPMAADGTALAIRPMAAEDPFDPWLQKMELHYRRLQNEKQNRGSDCSLIVVSLTTENNRIIHIRKAVAFSDFTFLLQTFCNLL